LPVKPRNALFNPRRAQPTAKLQALPPGIKVNSGFLGSLSSLTIKSILALPMDNTSKMNPHP